MTRGCDPHLVMEGSCSVSVLCSTMSFDKPCVILQQLSVISGRLKPAHRDPIHVASHHPLETLTDFLDTVSFDVAVCRLQAMSPGSGDPHASTM